MASFVPAPEFARAGKTAQPANRRGSGVAAFILAGLLALPVVGQAAPPKGQLPSGGTITSGSASIARHGNTMDIKQSSNRAVINWHQFDVGANASVRFRQPSSSSATLNRVIGSSPSQIYGNLSANGQVWLINPSGVVFGPNSSVNVGGLVTSTMDMTDEDFMQGKMVFKRNGATGEIINYGTITAKDGGLVALLAPTVKNEGIIKARLGSVVMAGGEKVTLDVGANGHIKVAVDPSTIATQIENNQLIQAGGGMVIMTSKAANALSASIVRNEGTIRAASLSKQNGTILLLADMQHGEVQAAGSLQADFVETSGADVSLADDLVVNTQGGEWLIDPTTIVIDADKASAIETGLASGDVTLSTADKGQSGSPPGGMGSDPGDIFVNADIDWDDYKLTLNADNNIYINAVMTASGNSELEMNAGSGDAGIMVGFKPGEAQGFAGRVDFPGRGGSGFLRINGHDYTVINLLGSEGDTRNNTLEAIRTRPGGFYALGSDIDASDTANWDGGKGFEPIGGWVIPESVPDDWSGTINLEFHGFSGVLNGLGHLIQDLNISRPDASGVGLFGGVSYATISNVGLSGGAIEGGWRNSGALIGEVSTSSGRNGDPEAATDAVITHVFSTANVKGKGYVGGIVGQMFGNNTISYSYSAGHVQGVDSVGGLVGYLYSGVVKNSYSTSDVEGDTKVGGLVGKTGSIFDAYIMRTYATGKVQGNSQVGGLVGYNGNFDSYGGDGVSIAYSYASGRVSGQSDVGGLVGSNISDAYSSNNYWNIDTTGQTSSALGQGLTTAEMKQKASFQGWDFDNTWQMDAGDARPTLRTVRANIPSLTDRQKQLITQYKDATAAELIVAVGNGDFVNGPSDPVWLGLYVNGKATDNQRKANRLQPVYDRYNNKNGNGPATIEDMFNGLVKQEIKTEGTMHDALMLTGGVTTTRYKAAIERYKQYQQQRESRQQQNNIGTPSSDKELVKHEAGNATRGLNTGNSSPGDLSLGQGVDNHITKAGDSGASNNNGFDTYKHKHDVIDWKSIAGKKSGEVYDTATIQVNGKKYVINAKVNGNGKYHSGGDYQCVELVKRYAKNVADESSPRGSLGNGHATAEGLAEKYSDYFENIKNGERASPIVGSVISMKTAYSAGHVAIAKSVKKLDENTIIVSVIEQNIGYGTKMSTNRIIVFKKKNGGWYGKSKTSNSESTIYDVTSWSNPT